MQFCSILFIIWFFIILYTFELIASEKLITILQSLDVFCFLQKKKKSWRLILLLLSRVQEHSAHAHKKRPTGEQTQKHRKQHIRPVKRFWTFLWCWMKSCTRWRPRNRCGQSRAHKRIFEPLNRFGTRNNRSCRTFNTHTRNLCLIRRVCILIL